MGTGSGGSAGGDVVGRRLLLLGGGLGALTAPLLTDAPAADAASGDQVILGRDNRATSVTTIRNVQDSGVGLLVRVRGESSMAVQAVSPNVAVSGETERGTGVQGTSVFGDGLNGHSLFGFAVRGNSGNGVGVDGESRESTGVSGVSRFGIGVDGGNLATDKPAVRGSAQNGSTGVQGLSGTVTSTSPASPPSTGVHGRCDDAVGTGVLAQSANGTALKVDGAAVFSRSGVLTVPAGARSVTQDDVELTSASLVLAVLRRHQAFRHVVAAVPHPRTSSFTVHLNLPASPGCEVAWFVVN
jgi:hypothetical protein